MLDREAFFIVTRSAHVETEQFQINGARSCSEILNFTQRPVILPTHTLEVLSKSNKKRRENIGTLPCLFGFLFKYAMKKTLI